MEAISRLAGRFQALADPTRLQLLAFIAEGEPSATDCIRHLRQSQPRVARHLKILVAAGLVEPRRVGRFVHYAVNRGNAAPGILAAAALAALRGLSPDPAPPGPSPVVGPAPVTSVSPRRPSAPPPPPAPVAPAAAPPARPEPEEPTRRPLEDFLL